MADVETRNNTGLMTRRAMAVPRGIAHATALFADRALNAEIWDVEGRHYVDFAGGIAVLNTGHCHSSVIAAVRDQLERFTHTAFQVMPYESYITLAERLNARAPIAAPCKTALFSTGAEAVENAVKIARAATGRSGVIAFSGGFHGRTLFTSALTGKVMPYKEAFGPMAGEVFHLPFPHDQTAQAIADSIAALELLFRSSIAPRQVAAIIIEPVQGEGGFHVAPPALFSALRNACDAHGIVLIADEVQSGFGRTGKFFAIEHSGVEPDLITAAKSLAGGFPLSAVIGRAEVMDAAEPGGLGGTYGGNPVACAAALAVLDIIDREQLLDRALRVGDAIRSHLARLVGQAGLPPMTMPRGPGAMIAFELVTLDGQPDAARAKRLTAVAANLGLILLSCGMYGNVIRILAPLTIEDDVLNEGLARLEAALRKIGAEESAGASR